ncbi:WD40 repeat-like protein [Rhizoctonia solani]|uniref:WD40 repeat-like protein n=1 Tax=Rhizoctonia solani TaxID=456999 RepID=A0A8H7M3D2_9AGAM|nr:WD40 repeat-like protein [Rhizoctonia solani]
MCVIDDFGHLNDGQVDDGVLITYCVHAACNVQAIPPLAINDPRTSAHSQSIQRRRTLENVDSEQQSTLCVVARVIARSVCSSRLGLTSTLASEPASSGQNTEPSRQDVIPSTNEPRLAVPSDTLPVPSALSADLKSLHRFRQGPILLFLTLLPKWMEPRAPSPARPYRPQTPSWSTINLTQSTRRPQLRPRQNQRKPRTKHGLATWIAQEVDERAGLIPSVGDAARVLLDCVDTTEAAVNNKQDYEDLATELTALSDTLAQQIEGMGSEAVSKCVSGVAQYVSTTTAYALADRETSGIEKQAKEIKKKKERGTARPLLEAARTRKMRTEHEYVECRKRSDGEHAAGGPRTREAGCIRLGALGNRRQAHMYRRHAHKVLSDLVMGTRQERTCDILDERHGGHGQDDDRILIREWLKQARATGGELLLHSDVGCVPGRGEDRTDGGIPAGAVLGDIPIDTQFEALLKEALQKTVEKGKGDALDNLVVVIDALDECEDQRGVETIVDMLFRYAPHLGLNEDIELYLNQELASIPLRVPESDVKQLVDRSGALFIYAATLVRYICTAKRSVDPVGRQGTGRTGKERIRAVLRTVLMAQEPIGVETIALLAGIDGSRRVKYALSPLRSVLHQSESTGLVSTLHASFPDFMFSHTRSGSYFCDMDKHSPGMAHRCFTLMKGQLRFNICDLPSSFIPMKTSTTCKTGSNTGSRVTGICVSVLGQSCQRCTWNNDLLEDLSVFLSERLLFWMEVMSLRRELLAGIEGFLTLKEWLRLCLQPSVSLHAAHLHLMPSILSSIKHGVQALLAPDARAGGAEGQSDGPQRDSRTGHLEHSLASMAVAYSGDGSRVATFASGSDDAPSECGTCAPALLLPAIPVTPVMSLGFVLTRQQAHSLWLRRQHRLYMGHGQWHTACGPIARSYRLSSFRDVLTHSTLIASASHTTLSNCGARTTALLLLPTSRSHQLCQVCYVYAHGTRLVSGSDDKTVRVWRVSDGSAVATPFQGHSGVVFLVAVSPDGMLVASGSSDCTVRVWRMSDGSLAAGPFVGHTGWIGSVGYSPDGTQVISGSDDGTVRVWNVREGMVAPASSGVSLAYITSLSFLPDGAHVLTVSHVGERHMWDVSSGISQPASPDIQVVRTDNKSVAAGPFDRSPRVWQFSHDGTRVIVGFGDGRIEGICLQTGQNAFELRSADYNWVDLIAESPDRSLLASINDTEQDSPILRIWSMAGPTLCFQTSDDLPLDPGPGQTLSGLYHQCHIDSDGWMVNSNNDLLISIPAEIADAGLSPFVFVIVTSQGHCKYRSRC